MKMFTFIHLALLAIALPGCMEQVDGYISDGRSTVFVCNGHNEDGSTIEYCWDGNVEDLEYGTGATGCHASGLFDRTSLVGCWYHCDSDAPGCNAHNGCYCE